MVATYLGKLVVFGESSQYRSLGYSQEALDQKIAEGALWGDLQNMSGPLVQNLRHDDGQPVLQEETILSSDVPSDAELFITTDIAYVYQDS